MRVLLMNDDDAAGRSIELMVKSEGYDVHATYLGEEAIYLGGVRDYDIILVELNAPSMPHIELLRSLQSSSLKTPILLVPGDVDIAEKLKGCGFSASDHLIRPFHKDELVTRIKAVVRRSKGAPRPIISTGNLSINLENKTVSIAEARVYLTKKEYEILELLSLLKGNTATKEMLLNHLYGGQDEPQSKIIDVFVCNLRRKLANASNGKSYIETIWGRGYMLRDPHPESTAISAKRVA